MRRIGLVVSILVAFAAPAFASPFQSKAAYALLVDISDGKALYEKRADASMSPASTTKILTAEVIFSRLAGGQLKLDDTFPISPHAATEGDAESGGSSMFAKSGSAVRVEDLLQGLLVLSGNDAAIALAEGVSGSEKAFAGIMNAHARAIGMSHSSFTNPWGRAGNRVTPRDMVKLAAHVIATYPQYYKFFSEPSFTWNGIAQNNRNPLLADGADGLKTGHLAASGFGLVGSAMHGGHRIVLVINGCKSERERASEGKRLMEYGFQRLDGG